MPVTVENMLSEDQAVNITFGIHATSGAFARYDSHTFDRMPNNQFSLGHSI